MLHISPLDMKECIYHFVKWQLHSFRSNGKIYRYIPLDMKGCIYHFVKWQIHPFISKGTIYRYISLDMKGCICHFAKRRMHPFISKGGGGDIESHTSVTCTKRDIIFTSKPPTSSWKSNVKEP